MKYISDYFKNKFNQMKSITPVTPVPEVTQ